MSSADCNARSLSWRWLGRVGFDEALVQQEEIVGRHAEYGDTLLLLEHDPVYTTSRRGKEENLPSDGRVPLRRIGRGGDVTYHGPGQLVGYLLVDLRARGGDVHRFLRAIEAGVIAVLDDLGVVAQRVDGRTGVWVTRRAGSLAPAGKIASIGIGVRRGISMHGFAINLGVDLSAFEAIIPCDLAGVDMTSVERETDRRAPRPEQVAPVAAKSLAEALATRGAMRRVGVVGVEEAQA